MCTKTKPTKTKPERAIKYFFPNELEQIEQILLTKLNIKKVLIFLFEEKARRDKNRDEEQFPSQNRLRRNLSECFRMDGCDEEDAKNLTYFADISNATRKNPFDYENVSGLIDAGLVRVYESTRFSLIVLSSEAFA